MSDLRIRMATMLGYGARRKRHQRRRAYAIPALIVVALFFTLRSQFRSGPSSLSPVAVKLENPPVEEDFLDIDPLRGSEHIDDIQIEEQELLQRSAHAGAVVLTISNYMYRTQLRNLQCSMSRLKLPYDVFVYAQDMNTHKFAKEHGLSSFALDEEDGDDVQMGDFSADRSRSFNHITRQKLTAVSRALIAGYDVLVTDADVHWCGDALKAIRTEAPSVDIVVMAEAGYRKLNSGFYFVTANERTRTTFKEMTQAIDYGKHDQDVFNAFLCEGRFGGRKELKSSDTGAPFRCVSKTGAVTHVLDASRWPSGEQNIDGVPVFAHSRDTLERLCKQQKFIVLHNNFIRARKKRARMIVKGMWFVDSNLQCLDAPVLSSPKFERTCGKYCVAQHGEDMAGHRAASAHHSSEAADQNNRSDSQHSDESFGASDSINVSGEVQGTEDNNYVNQANLGVPKSISLDNENTPIASERSPYANHLNNVAVVEDNRKTHESIYAPRPQEEFPSRNVRDQSEKKNSGMYQKDIADAVNKVSNQNVPDNFQHLPETHLGMAKSDSRTGREFEEINEDGNVARDAELNLIQSDRNDVQKLAGTQADATEEETRLKAPLTLNNQLLAFETTTDVNTSTIENISETNGIKMENDGTVSAVERTGSEEESNSMLSVIRSAEHQGAVVVTASNYMYRMHLRNLQCDLHRLGLPYAPVVFSLDALTHDFALSAGLKSVALSRELGDDVSPGAFERHGPRSFGHITRQKLKAVQTALYAGMDVLMTDADVHWCGDALEAVQRSMGDSDMLVMAEASYAKLNSGFYYVRSNKRTMELFDVMVANAHFGMHDQDVVNAVLCDTLFGAQRVRTTEGAVPYECISASGVVARLLDTNHYPSGAEVIKGSPVFKLDRETLANMCETGRFVVLHNNFIRADKKMARMIVKGMWYVAEDNYMTCLSYPVPHTKRALSKCGSMC